MGRTTDGKNLEFGKRGRAAPIERPVTSLERLKKIGARWWGKKQPPKKKSARPLGFKRPRPEI